MAGLVPAIRRLASVASQPDMRHVAMPSRGPWIDHFPDNFLWSNATLILKGMAPYGVVSLEEMDRACEKLRAREGEAGSRQGLVRGMARARRSDREARRRGAGQGPQDHRRRLLPPRRHLSLQRRALHRRRAPRRRRNAPTPTRSGTRASGCAIRTSSSSKCPTRAPPCPRCS